ncbi:hypothetical protein MUK42_29479, partial [Musa troglodytarum]
QRYEILKSLSHLTAAENTSAHPLLTLPPLVCANLKLSTMRKKCSTTSPNSFMAALALCSSGLPHDGDYVDELWFVPNVVPPTV